MVPRTILQPHNHFPIYIQKPETPIFTTPTADRPTMAVWGAAFILSLLFFVSSAEISVKVGVNYGLLGNNLPTASRSVQLIKQLNAGRVKLYEPNHDILKALAGTGLQVSTMVANMDIINISRSQKLSDQWVKTNVVPFCPDTLIRYVLVGNEVLSSYDQKPIWTHIVPTMRRIKASLRKFHIHKVKVGTTVAMDVLQSSFPPSNGTFRSDISGSVIRPLLQFLNRTKSFFFLDAYTYFPWSSQPQYIELDYALLEAGRNITYIDPGTGLTYTNLLDQMLDAVIFAMKRLGYPDIRLWIAETGWPNAGDIDQIGANVHNAATYNRNLMKKLNAKPPVGTPARPGAVLPSFIFSLYNENQKGGPGTERHWGLFYPNESSVYPIDLTGKTPESVYPPLPPPDDNEPYKGKIWCVVAEGANMTELKSALTYACGQGNGTCEPIQPGQKCYKPVSLVRHASFAFSSYWAKFRSSGGTCYFNGLALQTKKDPSNGSCKFPSVSL